MTLAADGRAAVFSMRGQVYVSCVVFITKNAPLFNHHSHEGGELPWTALAQITRRTARGIIRRGVETVRKTESGGHHTPKKGSRYFHSPSIQSLFYLLEKRWGMGLLGAGRSSLYIGRQQCPSLFYKWVMHYCAAIEDNAREATHL